MIIALLVWAIIILIIAFKCCPGFFGFMCLLGLGALVGVFIYNYFKTKKNLKEFSRMLNDIPPQPWDDDH